MPKRVLQAAAPSTSSLFTLHFSLGLLQKYAAGLFHSPKMCIGTENGSGYYPNGVTRWAQNSGWTSRPAHRSSPSSILSYSISSLSPGQTPSRRIPSAGAKITVSSPRADSSTGTAVKISPRPSTYSTTTVPLSDVPHPARSSIMAASTANLLYLIAVPPDSISIVMVPHFLQNRNRIPALPLPPSKISVIIEPKR